MFLLDHPKHALIVDSCSIHMLLVGSDQTPYFKCNDAAKVLGYVKYAQAVTNHVRPRQIKTLGELLTEGVPVERIPVLCNEDVLKTANSTCIWE